MAKNVRFSIVSATLVLLVVVKCAEGQTCHRSDYCSKSLCPRGQVHVACKPPTSECSSYTDVSTTDYSDPDSKPVRDYIVQLHNQYRNSVASGQNSRFKPAARMATLVWNCELASVAQYNAEQCAMRHDQCRRIDGNPWVGQNLAYVANWGKPFNVTTSIDKSVKMWYDENTSTTQNDLNKLPNDINRIGHFTQMMQDRCVSMGCASANYKKIDDEIYYTLWVCNYWFSNVQGQRVYETSSTPASKCSTGPNSQQKGLCSTAEQYDFGGLIPYN